MKVKIRRFKRILILPPSGCKKWQVFSPVFFLVILLLPAYTFQNYAQKINLVSEKDIECFYSSGIINYIDTALEDKKRAYHIPSDSIKIVKEYRKKQIIYHDLSPEDMNSFELDEEAEVDDIPFDTEKVFYSIFPDRLIFLMKDESELDDLPFDTRKIYKRYMKNKCD